MNTRALPLLTSSEMKCYRRCPREHHYTYRLGYRTTREADALRFGTLFHSALEMWWTAAADPLEGQQPSPLDYVGMAIRAADTARPFERVTAEALMIGYDARWGGEPLEVAAVEVQFTTPLVNPATGIASRTFQVAGKLDAVARRDGLAFLVEHKTCSEECGPGSDYVKRLRLDAQLSVYYGGARSLGYDLAGVIYDVIRKPGIRPYQAGKTRKVAETPEEFRARLLTAISEDPDRYYQRHMVVRLEAEQREAGADVWQQAQQMREAERLGRAPRNPDACIRYGRACAFFGVCTGEQSLEDPAHFRRALTPHEELSTEIAA